MPIQILEVSNDLLKMDIDPVVSQGTKSFKSRSVGQLHYCNSNLNKYKV